MEIVEGVIRVSERLKVDKVRIIKVYKIRQGSKLQIDGLGFNVTRENKKARLTLTNPRDAKRCQKFLHFEVITSSSQVGNLMFIVIKFLIQITTTYSS